MDQENDYELVVDTSDADSGGNRCAVDTPGFRESILGSRIMVRAYAAGVVIIAFFLGVLVVALGVLSFFYPDKANIAVAVLGGPLLMLVLKHGTKAVKTIQAKRQELPPPK